MDSKNNERIFEYFKIYGLHNERNITLEMDKNAKILVSDNGSGKTTLLSCMYYILDKSFEKLEEICFSKIEMKFATGVLLSISKSEITDMKFYPSFPDSVTERIFSSFSRKRLVHLTKIASTRPYFQFMEYFRDRFSSSRLPCSSREFYEVLNRLERDGFIEDTGVYKEWSDIVDQNVKLKVLYLPTYRRIEQDIEDFDYVSEGGLINFGMRDVQKRFDKISSDLKNSAVRLYNSLNAKVLTHLTSDYEADERQYRSISNIDVLRIVLGRVGDSLSSETKESIIRLVDNGFITEERYQPLVFVLSNLVDVYYAQKEQDDSIKEFVETVNKYLVSKRFVYDESKVEIKIVNLKNEITLDKLSSGEKQLVSIFSKLYLEDNETTYAVLFDEPELSLSMEWQMTLLPDIINSNRCGFLLAATHSPFIFNNELDCMTDNLCVDYIEDNDEQS
ncbi:ATP-binding protein [Vibrio parahaemolyticus]|uniref:ATP-binding protein n=1 Tax=Vibrio parahaemolyticus TaxID=670 RepID=UPI0021CF74C5